MKDTEVFEINTDYKTFFVEYLSLKRPVLEAVLSKIHRKKIVLNPKLLNVFALILYYNHKYKDMEEDIKWTLVFDVNTKEKIMKELNISNKHLNTYISVLRQLKLLTDKKISEPFMVNPNGGFDLTFKFRFDSNEK